MATKAKRVTPAQFGKITKLHKLLALALKDVRQVERRKNCRISMGNMLETNLDGICCACAAGSVMLQEFGATPNTHSFGTYPTEVCERLWAIDSLRQGDVGGAQAEIGLEDLRHDIDRTVADYDDNPAQWHADMRALLKDLKAANI